MSIEDAYEVLKKYTIVLLTAQLRKADELGIYVELDLDALPEKLSIPDDDITV